MSTTYEDQAHQNGYAPIEITQEHARVPFGTKDPARQSMPFEWAGWIFTSMRDAELSKEKPRPFSAWLSAACLHYAGMDDR